MQVHSFMLVHILLRITITVLDIDITRFKIGPPIFLWWVPVQNFAPKTHFDVIGTYRMLATSSTTFKKSGFSDYPDPESGSREFQAGPGGPIRFQIRHIGTEQSHF